ncbi:hypothetical protein [Micromonospora sp. 4G55]|uniref:hypothetical protein n=1 Tax=Micromonospora sp. 4G55 TaxID=2806102 RepID=UPI001A36DD00|nr:hypothetical protein [Micromonospora sp. 4G55]MBM0256969.1 hypothetical protein [Micromonospora sp. 4G55]
MTGPLGEHPGTGPLRQPHRHLDLAVGGRHLVDQLPRTTTGKLVRSVTALRAAAP